MKVTDGQNVAWKVRKSVIFKSWQEWFVVIDLQQRKHTGMIVDFVMWWISTSLICLIKIQLIHLQYIMCRKLETICVRLCVNVFPRST